MYRQGDILLVPVLGMPMKGINLGERNVLAFGEATGHAHRIDLQDLEILLDSKGNQYFHLEKPTELLHEEHDPVTVPAGTYLVIRQRELGRKKKEHKIIVKD